MEEPQTIARYRLTGELGRGGMGVVYRAEDPQLGREVAIKVILFPSHATDEVRSQLEQRFAREARAAAGIHHPGVVTVFDFGRDGDYLYLVMELVKGESLADRLQRGWRPERAEAFEIVAGAADGLAAAHAAGVVHRDVTPRNILLAEDGGVKVTDFGIARSLGEETLELTSTGMLVGSPSYMSPEQVRSRDFDERADLFSLGVVLYQLLAGELPFRSKDLTSLLYQIAHVDPLRGTEMPGKLGPAAHGFLRRCLAKAPEDRIQTAEELAAAARGLRAATEATELEETVALGQLQAAGRHVASRSRSRKGVWLGLAAVAVAAGAWLASGLARDRSSTPAAGESAAPVAGRDRPAEKASAVAEPADPPPVAVSQAGEAEPPAGETGAPDNSAPSPPPPFPPAPPPPAPPPLKAPETGLLETAEEPEAPLPEPSSATVDDIVSPVLAIDTQPREMTSSEIVLSGRVMDDQGGVTLTVDGEPVDVDDRGEFSTARRLQPGRNVLTVVALDGAGNQTLRSIEVTMETADPPPAVAGQPAGPAGTRPGPPRGRYDDRGDGTLVDTLSRLTWTKRPSDEIRAWRAAKSYCRKLELGRLDDWVLPTVEELEELFLAGTRLDSESSAVWSSSKHSSGAAWGFDLAQGRRFRQAVHAAEEGSAPRVLCVRRPQRQDDRRPQPQDPGLGSSPLDPRGGAQPPPPRGGQGNRPPPGGGGGGT